MVRHVVFGYRLVGTPIYRFFSNAANAHHAALAAVPFGFFLNIVFLNGFRADRAAYGWWAHHGSAGVWAMCCLILSMIGAFGLLPLQGFVRRWSALTLCIGHGCIATGFYLTDPTSPGTITYSILAAMAAWGYWLVPP